MSERTRRPRLPSGFGYCLGVFLGVRVVLELGAILAVALLPHVPVGGAGGAPGPVGVPGWAAHAITPGWHNAATVWERFDALWYLRIAAHGYASGDGSAAFFPLFPLAVRAVSFLIGGHPLAAGLIVSNGAAFGALLALYSLTAAERSEETARGAVVFLSIFPTAFFLVAPYSESLFLLLVLTCFWAVRRRRWALAGLAGALAALTRNLGLLLVLPLAAEAVHQAMEARPRRLDPRALWSLAPAAGTAIYLWFWRGVSGDWLAPLHQQAGWERGAVSPLSALWQATLDAWRFVGLYPGGYHQLDWVISVPVLAAAVVVAVRYRPSYGLYVWASVLVPLGYVFGSRPLMSFPRFALPLFPVFWVIAEWSGRGPRRRELAVLASSVLLGILLLLFTNWYYVF